MPRNYVFSINDNKHDPKISRHLAATNSVHKPLAYCWDFPEEYPSWFHRDFVFPSEDTFLMRDVVICPYSGGVWTPERLVLGESIGSLNKALTFGKALPAITSTFPRHLSATFIGFARFCPTSFDSFTNTLNPGWSPRPRGLAMWTKVFA
jgi:hypothetical protein